MATQETQQLDNIISSRRALMLGGGALATLVLAKSGIAQTTTFTDTDILNFALNLEYLEGEFYTLATAGQTLSQFGTGTGAGSTTAGTAVITTKNSNSYTSCKVPFTLPNVAAYALETAAEERLHVTFLRQALASAAVTEPNIDLVNSFAALGTLIGAPGFDPFLDDYHFLLGAYIFEDVGVSAYHGAAGLISSATTLSAAAKIHAVEAYHAGLIRTSIYAIDQQPTPIGPPSTMRVLAQRISGVRATLDGTAGATPDDIGLTIATYPLNGGAGLVGSTIVNADSNSIGWSRTTSQVLSIVFANGAAGTTSGGFFPAGVNGNIKTV